MPFTYELQTRHAVGLHRTEFTAEAKELQELQKRDKKQFDIRLEELKKLGREFGTRGSNMFELFDAEAKVEYTVGIKFQVEGPVITWIFDAPKDETYQEYRNILYDTAANAHDHVTLGCERYYRGNDSYHLKKMHTNETEPDYNHNHYRRRDDQDITPTEVREHLKGFALQKDARYFFPDLTEIDVIIARFETYYNDWIYEGADRSLSLQKQWQSERSRVFTPKDLEEDRKKHVQEPCRINTDHLSEEQKAKVKEERLRSLGSGPSGLNKGTPVPDAARETVATARSDSTLSTLARLQQASPVSRLSASSNDSEAISLSDSEASAVSPVSKRSSGNSDSPTVSPASIGLSRPDSPDSPVTDATPALKVVDGTVADLGLSYARVL